MFVFRRTCMALVVAGVCCASSAQVLARQTPSMSDLVVPVMPVRKGGAPAPRALPALPSGADRVTPLTLHVRVTTRASGRVSERRQTVTRTSERVHIVNGDASASAAGGEASGVEWLFERNPVDPRRASATYVSHADKTIVTYSDSDLHTMLGISGWAHVLTMGLDPTILARVTPSSAPRTFDAPDGTRLVIESANATVDLQLVRPADLRFPRYRVVNLADWLEEH